MSSYIYKCTTYQGGIGNLIHIIKNSHLLYHTYIPFSGSSNIIEMNNSTSKFVKKICNIFKVTRNYNHFTRKMAFFKNVIALSQSSAFTCMDTSSRQHKIIIVKFQSPA